MEPPRNLSRTTILPSSVGAERMLQEWLQSNQIKRFRDRVEGLWENSITSQVVPSPSEPGLMVHRLDIVHKTKVSVEMLLKQGVLNEEKDARLISLLGEMKANLLIRGRPMYGLSEEEFGLKLNDYLIKAREKIQSNDFAAEKLSVLQEKLDRSAMFGAAAVDAPGVVGA